MRHLKVLIYSRVSNADEINSSISQEQICKDYLHSISEIKNFTYEIYDVFIEEPGLSGGEYYNRPLYIKMLDLMNAKQIDAVCVKESSRLDRNTEHSEKLRRLAKRKGILLLSRDLDYDIHSPSGQFFYTINSAKNEYERNVTGERTRLAIRNDMRKGKIHGHPIPLGFKKHQTEGGKWEPVEEELILVKLIFETFNRTISYSLTANEINRLNYKSKKGTDFSPDLIKRILSNRKYLGEQKIPGEDLVVSLPYGEVIDRKIFELAQINMQKINEMKNSNRKANRISLLIGLLHSSTGRKFSTTCSGKNSDMYSYYRIQSEDISIPSHKIEKLILDSVGQIKQQGELRNHARKIRASENLVLKEIKLKIQTTEKAVAKLNRDKNEIFNLLLTPESRSITLVKMAEEKILKIDFQIERFNESIRSLNNDLEQEITTFNTTSEAARTLNDEIDDALTGKNRILQRKIIRSLIKKITVDFENMTIKIDWQIKSTKEELLIYNDFQIPPITRYDEIQFKLLGNQASSIENTPLYRLYVIEKHSSTQLAKKLGVTRSTILKYLKKLDIKRNKIGSNIKRKRGLAYGQNHCNGNFQKNNIEQARIEKARKLRNEGMSFRKIATLFNELSIPTKHKKRWHGRSIQQILKQAPK